MTELTKSFFINPAIIRAFQINKQTRLLSGFFLLRLVFTVGQDYVQTSLYHTAFYLSESLLFTLHWLLFIPIGHLLILSAKKHKGQKSFFFRVQLITGLSLFHLLFFSLLIYGISVSFFNHTYTFLPELKRGFAEDLYRYLLIYTLLTAYLFYTPIQPAKKIETVHSNHLQTIQVYHSGHYIPVPVADILYIQTDHPYIRITTNNGIYLHNESLSGLFARLDETCFIRIHRSAIIQINRVKSFRSRLNGDYDVTMNNGETLRLSRNFSAGFKRHFSGQTVQQANSSSQPV